MLVLPSFQSWAYLSQLGHLLTNFVLIIQGELVQELKKVSLHCDYCIITMHTKIMSLTSKQAQQLNEPLS